MSARRRIEAVVLGCSAGGVQAMLALFPKLSVDFKPYLIVVCHAGAEGVELLCEVLGRVSALPVREAAERDSPQPGVIYLAPAGYHLYLEREGQFALSIDPKVCFVRPSIDILFESAAARHRSKLLAVVLSGANEDGARGLQYVRRLGGYAIVQDPEDAAVPQMPEAALRIAGADDVLPLSEIATRINEFCS
jgi:two-component system chemotaxis response regulator CheB